MSRIARERMYVVFILTFFSLLFWAFFEQSGSSVNNFTDRNVDRVFETSTLTEDQVGKTVELKLTVSPKEDSTKKLDFLSQEFLGQENASTSCHELLARAMRWSNDKKKDKKDSDEEIAKKIKAVQDQKQLTMTALTFFREYAKRDEVEPRSSRTKGL